MATSRRRVGVLGYGSLGRFLCDKLLNDATASTQFELVFVWNRDAAKLEPLPAALRCTSIADAVTFAPDIIVEVCHPNVSKEWGPAMLAIADFFCGSPTVFADAAAEAALRAAATAHAPHGLYVPSGALWGALDIAKMADTNSLGGLTITMAKHPASLKLLGDLAIALQRACDSDAPAGEVVLYDGPARALCSLAPNNVNTIACGCIAAHTLGFDGVRARLVADARLDAHVITIDVRGLSDWSATDGAVFRVQTERFNPAAAAAVTGAQTYTSFLASLMHARGRGGGVHLC